MAIAKKQKEVTPPKDISVQTLVAETLYERWDRTRLVLGYKNIQDVIKLAMERLMAEDDLRLGDQS